MFVVLRNEFVDRRETLQIVHEIQMKKLQENYSERIRDAEQWPDRLQSELNREREQHRIELIELERRLKENFAAVRNRISLIFRFFIFRLGIKY